MNSALTRPAGGPADRERFWRSFFAAGFECSTFIRTSGERIDLVAATKHDELAQLDYLRLQELGIRVAREGIRWHLVEATPGRFDFSSVVPILRAARATGTQIIWDLCHFGWPDHLDLFSEAFVVSLARFGSAFAEWLCKETSASGFFVPVNEISYFSWASGDEGSMFPFQTGKGFALKRHLVRAAIRTMEAISAVMPTARYVHVDPIIHVVADPKHPGDQEAAAAYRLSQFQAWDMLSGRLESHLGGDPKYLDIIGVNFYRHNQWFYNLKGFHRVRKFRPLSRKHCLYRPFREMLVEVQARYGRPIFIAETGAEGRARANWFRYVCEETLAAVLQGVAVQGICLYPILNHPGWEDDRHCHNALWDYPDEKGERLIYSPLAAELARWQQVFDPPAQLVPNSHDVRPERQSFEPDIAA